MLCCIIRAAGVHSIDDHRPGVLVANGDHFTADLDLVDVGPYIAGGRDLFPADGRDPWRLDGDWTKPVVAAAHGRCLALGIELLLAVDIWIAASDARFAQLEVVDGADAARARAREIAHVIADRAEPLGIQATLASAHLARTEGDAAAVGRLRPEVTRLFGTADAAEGVQSFVERRPAQFRGYQPVAGRGSSPRTSSCAWRQRAGSWSRST
jgi:enoyl-CoA hydratase/carnithine racemase